MNTKKRSVITCVLLVWILLSSCAPGQLLSPTITSTPLSTATQRPTLTPTPSKFPSPPPTIDLTGTAISETMVVYEMERLATDFCEKKKVFQKARPMILHLQILLFLYAIITTAGRSVTI
jgi:hypothetical protein